MKILLIDIDSKIPNLALKKIEKYHLDRGDKVIWNNELFRNIVDKTYVSCIFTKNKNKCWEFEGRAEIGGSGYDLVKTLPPKIEQVKPRINLGFTTRGCIRKCLWCIVPKKEGKIRIEGDLYDIWDGKAKRVIFLDNNATAFKSHLIKVLRQLQKEKIKGEYNQGLDIRLIDDEIAKELKKTKLTELYFAWDNIKDEPLIRKGIQILKKAKIKSFRFYVLVGFNTTFEEDLYRFNTLKEITIKEKLWIRPYCMRYEDKYYNDKYIKLAQWVNMPWLFMKMDYPEAYTFMVNRSKYKK